MGELRGKVNEGRGWGVVYHIQSKRTKIRGRFSLVLDGSKTSCNVDTLSNCINAYELLVRKNNDIRSSNG